MCMASYSMPLHSLNYMSIPALSSSLVSSFKICDIQTPDLYEATKILFAIHNFDNATSLADSLTLFCRAYEEIFEDTLCSSSAIEPRVTLNLHYLKAIISLSWKYMRKFDHVCGRTSADAHPTQAAGDEDLFMPSLMYSQILGSILAPLKDSLIIGDVEDTCQQKTQQKQYLEEFSVVLALKDSILSSVLPGGRDHSVIVRLMMDVFLCCDLERLLMHEVVVREGLAVEASKDREVGESARESRAASIMQNMQEDHRSFDGQLHTVVDNYILCSLFLLPPPSLYIYNNSQ